ncbi:MAG: UDP-N-acetylmuramoyl-L-alanine--D-glutamate ligase [Chloroflexi bacterium]|nr:UDP-N-acetylmuramoyl-L-alanine--D-glutamate ligase [Chloroflexota bacterium]
MDFKGKKVTVVGLGREGVALTRFLSQAGALVTVSDAKPASDLAGSLNQIQGLPVRLSLGGNRVEDTVAAEVVFVSPGVPLNLPALEAARVARIPFSSLTQLFFQLCPAPVVGITGTSGKTTTTALVGEMFRCAGRPVVVGGNIGRPLLDELGHLTAENWVVLELSSFQLELAEASPHVAVITNVTPNHLDMHASLQEYIAAKANILNYQRAEDIAVINYDNPVTRGLSSQCQGEVLLFSSQGPVEAGTFIQDGWVVFRRQGREEALLPVSSILLLGAHNRENVLAACAAAGACYLPSQAMAEAVSAFTGVEHRLERVAEVEGVEFYNDSIATTPERAMAGIRAFERPVVLIAGGRDKHLPLEAFSAAVVERCQGVVLYGEAALRLGGAIERQAVAAKGRFPLLYADSFAQAVEEAFRLALRGGVVLLSPACSSFDMFPDFEARGRKFKGLVMELQTRVQASRDVMMKRKA